MQTGRARRSCVICTLSCCYNVSCDCKLAGTRVDPVSIGVVDVASFYILISREMQSDGTIFKIFEYGMGTWESVATCDQ